MKNIKEKKRKSDQIEEQSVQCRNNKPHNSVHGLTQCCSNISMEWDEHLEGSVRPNLNPESHPFEI